MVNKCSAYGCKSGYASVDNEKTTKGLSFHSFPLNNPDLCEKWIRANPRDGFEPSKNSKMCSLHFLPTDFVSDVKDTNKSRLQKRRSESNEPARLKKKLRDDAVPSVFLNAPSYHTKQGRTTSKCSSSAHREYQQQQLEELEASFIESDTIDNCTLKELENRLKIEITMPSDFH